ncbi:MAG: endonuclease/exonuclease/phosphatase family protein [Planctomycetes bacterium]|nr:endonuclease/exonuclease/phosphatase family protein [Planctomycetota bacterium]
MAWRFPAFVFLTLLAAGCDKPTSQSEAPLPSICVMTFNVNWGMPRAAASVEAIESSGADIVCLQEVQPQWEALIRARLGERYPRMLFHHAPHPAGGLAVLSRGPLTWRAVVTPPSGWFPALLVQAETAIGSVDVLNVHLRPSVADDGRTTLGAIIQSPHIHRREIRQIMDAAGPDRPLIVCGDLNENDNGAAVMWLTDRGLANALPRFDTTSPTWHCTRGRVCLTGRYDHIFFSSDLDCLAAGVLPCRSSDHSPVTATFQAAMATRRTSD